ncbi:MAG: hypothetical protein IKX46_06900 [Verrucomicrobia bacterium]|nr:hypothetical protein [Verrucomicrobiota bacterium]MBR5691659.1 hypothetical protein [Verrucomicrobiota bacterium]
MESNGITISVNSKGVIYAQTLQTQRQSVNEKLRVFILISSFQNCYEIKRMQFKKILSNKKKEKITFLEDLSGFLLKFMYSNSLLAEGREG